MTGTLAHILAMIRFSHTLFALPFALLAAAMAWTVPAPDGGRPVFRIVHLAGILVCMVCARSAAMAQNRIADRRIDAANPRTQGRHLPSGLLSLSSVVAFTIGSSVGFVAGTLLFLPNWLPLSLSVPVLFFLFGYSYTKRFTVLAHFWLGAALMLAPVSVWIALRGETVTQYPADILPALLLGVAVLLWVAGFDIIYACQDAEFDAKAKLRSVPARFGVAASLRIAAGCHLGMVLVLLALPYLSPQVPFGAIYFAAVAAVGTLLVYEHWIVRPDDLTRVNVAFFHVNWIVSTGLFLFGTIDLLT
jgi:4-hydroxybenzoate polyprenyltransferase